jgi:hypothetical protein
VRVDASLKSSASDSQGGGHSYIAGRAQGGTGGACEAQGSNRHPQAGRGIGEVWGACRATSAADARQLAAGGEGARAVLQDIFPDSIWMEPGLSGDYLIAVLSSEGVGALL